MKRRFLFYILFIILGLCSCTFNKSESIAENGYVEKIVKMEYEEDNSFSLSLEKQQSDWTLLEFDELGDIDSSNSQMSFLIAQEISQGAPVYNVGVDNTTLCLDFLENLQVREAESWATSAEYYLLLRDENDMAVCLIEVWDNFIAINHECFYETKNDEFTTMIRELIPECEELSKASMEDELSNRGIPYKYEMPLTLETSGRTVIFRPDFTIMNKRTGKRYILEHLGMLDNPDYLNHALDKINIYEKNGYLLGDKLILLHETSMAPLSTNVMKSYIERYFE